MWFICLGTREPSVQLKTLHKPEKKSIPTILNRHVFVASWTYTYYRCMLFLCDQVSLWLSVFLSQHILLSSSVSEQKIYSTASQLTLAVSRWNVLKQQENKASVFIHREGHSVTGFSPHAHA